MCLPGTNVDKAKSDKVSLTAEAGLPSVSTNPLNKVLDFVPWYGIYSLVLNFNFGRMETDKLTEPTLIGGALAAQQHPHAASVL